MVDSLLLKYRAPHPSQIFDLQIIRLNSVVYDFSLGVKSSFQVKNESSRIPSGFLGEWILDS